jgi:diketogulonate reductase-like aldo/keto reductase
MPYNGLGTYAIDDSDQVSRAITEIGYRAFDCASHYLNEKVIGEGIRKAIDSGKVKREELFVISKCWMDEVEDVEAACKRSLERFGLDYLDLYYVHWPVAVKTTVEPTEEDPNGQHEKINLPIHKIYP